ncbi:hypothetical protein [Streptomyces sp. NPDC018610]|uniref:hypothetical protein n=1 Tax=Streptomyces sp. NPDC018610 TaxID=3365049 RepID=UPI0037A1D26B
MTSYCKAEFEAKGSWTDIGLDLAGFVPFAERVFNHATCHERPLTSPVRYLDEHVFPKVIDRSPRRKIPGLADAVKPGENGKTFIDPTSWVSRGAETAYRGYKLYASAETAVSDEVHGTYEKYKDAVHHGLEAPG